MDKRNMKIVQRGRKRRKPAVGRDAGRRLWTGVAVSYALAYYTKNQLACRRRSRYAFRGREGEGNRAVRGGRRGEEVCSELVGTGDAPRASAQAAVTIFVTPTPSRRTRQTTRYLYGYRTTATTLSLVFFFFFPVTPGEGTKKHVALRRVILGSGRVPVQRVQYTRARARGVRSVVPSVRTFSPGVKFPFWVVQPYAASQNSSSIVGYRRRRYKLFTERRWGVECRS